MDKNAIYQDVLTFWKWIKNCEEYPADDMSKEAESAKSAFESANSIYENGSRFLRRLIMLGIEELEMDCVDRRMKLASEIYKKE